MQTEPGNPNTDQEAAFANADVRTIVDALIEFNTDVRLLAIAHRAMISREAPPRRVLQAQLGGERADPAMVDAAERIVSAGLAIEGLADQDEKGRRLGAVLDRLVWRLCSRRRPDETSRETHVVLTTHKHVASRRTGRLDVVVEAIPFEAYECKFGGGIEQVDIDELGEVFVTAQAEGVECRPCLATMGTERQLRARASATGIVPDEILYFAEQIDLPNLAVRPPTRRYR